jgi:hypothetical protein
MSKGFTVAVRAEGAVTFVAGPSEPTAIESHGRRGIRDGGFGTSIAQPGRFATPWIGC